MRFTRPMCVLSTLLALVVVSVPALASAPMVTKASVPFEFVAAGKTLPAGEYMFSASAMNGLLTLSNARGDTALIVFTNHVGPTNGAAKPQLVFKKRDGKHYLSEVWLRTQPGGQALALR